MRLIGCIAAASIGSLMGATAVDRHAAIAATAEAPLSFERATGGGARWMARGNGFLLTVGAAEVEAGLGDERLRIRFVGGNHNAPSVGLDALPGKVNYFVGRDPKSWLRDVPTYARVRYSGVYPGVDLLWHGNQGRLEYDLDLQPGSDASRIAMHFEGARRLSLDASGDLRVEMAAGSLSLKLPVVYQDGAGGRQRIDARYDLRAGNQVGFHLAAYDKSRGLVIDPTLVYASYFGNGNVSVKALAVDGSGNVYIGGFVVGTIPFPVVNALQQGSPAATGSPFVSKFDPTGKTLLYSTYIGSPNADQLNGIAVDPSGNLVGTGYTTSADFPLVNPAQSTFSGHGSAFAFKLNAAGNGLVYSTYLGGPGGNDPNASGNAIANGQAITVDASGSAYVTGAAVYIESTAGALNACCAFVAKLSSAGVEVYRAILGANQGNAIAVDPQGAAYVAGYSDNSHPFPKNPPGARTYAGSGDAFVAKLNPYGTALVWATLLGGSGTDTATAIALGTDNVVYFAGATSSPDLLVTPGVIQPTYGGNTDAFVASLNADGSSFGFATYFGGGRSDTVKSLVVGAKGLVVAGQTYSRDLPVVAALQPAFPGPPYSFLKSKNSGTSFTAADHGLPSVKALSGRILPDPSVPGVIVVDTDGGTYRTADDGATWVSVLPSSFGGTVRSLSNPSVLYSPGVSAGCGVSKSTDGGQTWAGPCYGFNPGSLVMGISPTDPNTVLAVDGNELFRSTNGGLSFGPWMTVLPFMLFTPQGGSLVASPDGSMYAVTGSLDNALYRSLDAGLTWTQLSNGLPSCCLTGFALSTRSPSVLYAAFSGNVYKSVNAGAVWSEAGAGAGVNELAVDPSDPQTVYGTSLTGVLISTDGGVTWKPTGATVNSDSLNGVAVNPTNGEVYLSGSVPPIGFVAELSTDGKALAWSTYYGPYDQLTIGGLTAAPSGNIWVAGSVYAGSLPLTPDARNANTAGAGMAFLASIADATASCGYAINPGTQYSYKAGQLVFAVTAPSGCAWTATPSDDWIHLVRNSGTGSATIPLDVDANPTAATRTGTVSVNGQTYTIVQPASSCTYQLSSSTPTSAGGTVTITVAAPDGCPWDVELESGDPATVTSATTGTGNGTVTISIPADIGVANLSYQILIGGQGLSIAEPAKAAPTISGIGVSGGGTAVAQNAWISIYGTDLAPLAVGPGGLTWSDAPSFASGQMPTALHNVSVTVNGIPAYIYYVSSTQLNVLTPLDSTTGSVAVKVNNGIATSAPYRVILQPASPGFLLFGDSVHIAAEHADGTYLGPASMSVPGYTFAPAAPNEVVVLFGDGFGLPATALTAGSSVQKGELPTLPQIMIGGTLATVEYVGLISPGLYQINVRVPPTASSGDNNVIATYAGAASPGAMIAVAQ